MNCHRKKFSPRESCHHPFAQGEVWTRYANPSVFASQPDPPIARSIINPSLTISTFWPSDQYTNIRS
jgi:hypothetical protein